MTRQTRTLLGSAIAAILLLGPASIAHAQYGAPPPGYGGYPPPPPPPPPSGMYRSGLIVGAALGGGNISASNCAACGGGPALAFHIGGMITPQAALMLDIWGIAHYYDDGLGGTNTLTNSMFTIAGQYWVAEKLWLKGGLGSAHITLADYAGNTYGTSENALAVLLAGGFEILQINTFALDLQLRFGHGAYSGGGASNVAVLIGANWY